jgi:hypothetical protein
MHVVIINVTPVAMVTTRVKPREPSYACKYACSHVFLLTFRAGIPAKMVVVLALDSVP